MMDKLNEHKVCFISCINNEDYEKEEIKYIENLHIPENYEIEMLSIKDAVSMTAGYNKGMRASDAKYKVYLHQDVFIVNKYFIYDMLRIFKDEEIGMIGMVGAIQLSEDGIMWNGPRIGKIYANCIYNCLESTIGQVDGPLESVEAIDGLLMATQYDLTWRDDLFHNWDFYDVSQSQEFLRHGYKVVVPNQKNPWCIHDDGFSKLKNYYDERKIFLREYKNYNDKITD